MTCYELWCLDTKNMLVDTESEEDVLDFIEEYIDTDYIIGLSGLMVAEEDGRILAKNVDGLLDYYFSKRPASMINAKTR